MKKTIAFITTHIINKAVISEYVKLSKVSNCTCLLVVDNTNLKMKSEGPITEKEFYGIKVKCFFFNEGIHNGLNLPWFFENKKADRFSDVMWYNSEYRFYYIRKFFPDYDYYWQFEYDVFLNGESYQAFFDRYSGRKEDLLVADLREEKAGGEWFWSHNIKWKYDNLQIYGSFFPVVRMTGKAIDYLYQQRLAHERIYERLADKKNAWWIFCELFVPTELIQRGFTAYCIDGQHLRFEPEYDFNEDRVFEHPDNLLYHPVKGQFVEREKKLKNEKITLEMELTELKGKLAKIQEGSTDKTTNKENRHSNKIKPGFVDISIIIPIYNVAEYLIDCLESVKRNITGLTAEVLLIDDGSTDASSVIAGLYAEQEDCFYYYRKENGGLSSARNYGVSLASGKYIFFIDSDDMMADGILQKMLAAAERNGTDLTVCNVAKLVDKNVVDSDLHLRAFHTLRDNISHIKQHPGFVYDATSWNKLILRSFYINNGVEFPEGYLYEDMLPNLMMHYCCNNVSVLRETGYLWRIRTGINKQITQVVNKKTLTDKIEMMSRTMRYVQNNVPETEIEETLVIKFLAYDFNGWLNQLRLLPREEAAEYMDLIAGFINQNINKKLMIKLPLLAQQVCQDILQGDYIHLLQGINYKEANYSRTPILYSEETGFTMKVPDNLVKTQNRSADYEFGDNVFPVCSINSIMVNGSTVSLQGYLYISRISIPFGGKQYFKATLLNEITGAKFPLQTESVRVTELTASQGSIFNYDDYMYYQYDYDGAGFRIIIDFKEIASRKEFAGDNYIILSFDFNGYRGDWLLKGILGNGKQQLEQFTYKDIFYIGRANFDLQGIIRVVLQDRSKADYSYKPASVHLPVPFNRMDAEKQISELQNDMQRLAEAYSAIENSVSFKLGRALTFIPRKIRDLMK